MKNLSKIFVLAFIFSLQMYSQNNTGKAYYTSEEVKQMCGVPIDTAKTPLLQAKQDSMYRDYISRKGGLQKTQTTPE